MGKAIEDKCYWNILYSGLPEHIDIEYRLNLFIADIINKRHVHFLSQV